MRRYYFKEKLSGQERLSLTGDLFHHIFDVCRQQVGHRFELVTEESLAFLVEVLSVSKREATVRVLGQRLLPRPQKPFIHLIMSVPKIPTFEAVIEKAIELGVQSIQPVISDFSFIKSLKAFPCDKRSRWEKILLQATQQSGRGNLLELKEPTSLAQQMSEKPWRRDRSLGLFAYEGDCRYSLKEYLQVQKQNMNSEVDHLWAIIGSEGGFSESEVQSFKQLDLEPVSLGEQVLRVETACLTIVSSLKYEFDSVSKV